MDYTISVVENLLRNYYTLQQHPDSTFSFYKMDLESGLKALKRKSEVLYFTIVNVFVNGVPIQDQAEKDSVTTRQVNRRLHDGLYALTIIMNGEAV
jgi:hypothetical protein